MVILVGNDDGIESEGIVELAKALSELGKVVVCAPHKERSAAGHSVTLRQPFRVEKRMIAENIEGYAIWGTPRDCVELGVFGILKEKPDLIVTGINKGPNLANDMICSGTLGSASAGLVAHVPAIAMSLDYCKEYDFSVAAKIAVKAAKWFINQLFNKDFVLNINVPALPENEIKGVVTSGFGGYHDYKFKYESYTEDGALYYRMLPNERESVYYNEDTTSDLYAFDHGYVVINPVGIDVIQYQNMDKVKELAEIIK